MVQAVNCASGATRTCHGIRRAVRRRCAAVARAPARRWSGAGSGKPAANRRRATVAGPCPVRSSMPVRGSVSSSAAGPAAAGRNTTQRAGGRDGAAGRGVDRRRRSAGRRGSARAQRGAVDPRAARRRRAARGLGQRRAARAVWPPATRARARRVAVRTRADDEERVAREAPRRCGRAGGPPELQRGEVGARRLRLGAQVASRLAQVAQVGQHREPGGGRECGGARARPARAAGELRRQQEQEQRADVQVAARVRAALVGPLHAGEQPEAEQHGEQADDPRRDGPQHAHPPGDQCRRGDGERPAPGERRAVVAGHRPGQSRERGHAPAAASAAKPGASTRLCRMKSVSW